MNGANILIRTENKLDMEQEKKLKAVLFDMDGVLLDSEEFICRAGIRMFREKGFEVSADDFLEFTGMGENRYLGGVAGKHGIPFELEKDKARTYEIYEGLVAGKLRPFEGVIEFIEKCRLRGLKLAVASSADPPKVRINLREIGIRASTFESVVTGLDIEHRKPAPDIFLRAAEDLNIPPDHCLVIEDAISGVAAGKAAGAKVLALTTSFSAEELTEADWIAGSFKELPEGVLDW
jgi:beta-phosphoglucomutase